MVFDTHVWSLSTCRSLQLLLVVLDDVQLGDPEGSYKAYRSALKAAPLPALPYLGVYLKDLTFIEDGERTTSLMVRERGGEWVIEILPVYFGCFFFLSESNFSYAPNKRICGLVTALIGCGGQAILILYTMDL